MPFYLRAHPFSKSLHSANVHNSTLRVTESTTDLTLFANNQGSEIPDSEQFYKILQTLYSNEDSAVNNTNFDIVTTFTPVTRNGSIWNDTTIIHI